MRWTGLCAVAFVGALIWQPGLLLAQQTSTVLEVRYADGRTTQRPVQARAGSAWTGMFPRVAGADTRRAGLPLAALEISDTPAGHATDVTVALLYGRPHQHRIKVDTVTVTPGTPVTVERLTRFGVDPITVSIVEVKVPERRTPAVTSVSPELTVTVEASPNRQAHRVVVVNHGGRPVVGFYFAAYRNGRLAFSGARRGPRREPLLSDGEGVAFELPASGQVIDHIAISSVIWNDGSFDGDPADALRDQAVHAGVARQLQSVMQAFRDATDAVRPQSFVELRARIGALAVSVPPAAAAAVLADLPAHDMMTVDRVASMMTLGMQQVKDAVLDDLDGVVLRPSAASPTVAAFLSNVTLEYEAWMVRIAETAVRPAEQSVVALTGVRVVNPDTGTVSASSTVLIRNGRVAQVVAEAQIPTDRAMKVEDLGTLDPGAWADVVVLEGGRQVTRKP